MIQQEETGSAKTSEIRDNGLYQEKLQGVAAATSAEAQ
jgi:hypothetical protein